MRFSCNIRYKIKKIKWSDPAEKTWEWGFTIKKGYKTIKDIVIDKLVWKEGE